MPYGSKLPKLDTPDGKKISGLVPHATDAELNTLAQSLGYRSTDKLVRAVREQYNVRREHTAVGNVKLPEPPTIVIPEIKILKYKAKKGAGKPETQCLLLGDWHFGEVTPTFNPSVANARLDYLFQSVMRINELHRHLYPLEDLAIFLLGDIIHGENPYQGAKIESVATGAVSQVYDLAFPKLLSLLSSFRENFASVKAYCVPGNHGRISREAPETSNFDLVLYKALSTAKLPDGIEIILPTDFCQLVTLQGFRFFVHHGDATRASQGIPYFAQTRRVMSWYVTYGGFDYAVSGHWHKDDFYRISARTKQISNGALVSDDPFALKTMGTSSIPTQTTFGVNESRGVTWYYTLQLETPKKAKVMDERE